jgi:hypothetical protein
MRNHQKFPLNDNSIFLRSIIKTIGIASSKVRVVSQENSGTEGDGVGFDARV